MVSVAAVGIATAVSQSAVLIGLEDRVKDFAESTKVLMAALDEVAKLHPFVAGSIILVN